MTGGLEEGKNHGSLIGDEDTGDELLSEPSSAGEEERLTSEGKYREWVPIGDGTSSRWFRPTKAARVAPEVGRGEVAVEEEVDDEEELEMDDAVDHSLVAE